ncbi:hypothetical protein OC834_001113 [Tilletia horrida]|nr:hypothetical protein OC834_001113 [Tilletia horrida]
MRAFLRRSQPHSPGGGASSSSSSTNHSSAHHPPAGGGGHSPGAGSVADSHSSASTATYTVGGSGGGPSSTVNGMGSSSGFLAPPFAVTPRGRNSNPNDRPHSSASISRGPADIGYGPSRSPSPSLLDYAPDRQYANHQQQSLSASTDDDRRHRRRRSIGLLHNVINGNGLSIPSSSSSHPAGSPSGRNSVLRRPSSQRSDMNDSSYDTDVDAAPSYYNQALKRGLLSPQPPPSSSAQPPQSPLRSSPSHPPSAASALASRELRKQRSSSPTRRIPSSPPAHSVNFGMPLGRVRSQVEEWEASSRYGSEVGHGSTSSHQAPLPPASRAGHYPPQPPPPVPAPSQPQNSIGGRFKRSSSFSTQSLAAQLNELAVAFADGLLDPDEYRILRQGIFDRMSAQDEIGEPEAPAIKGMPGSRISIDAGAPPSLLARDTGEAGHLVDDSASSVYESAHSHRSGGPGGGNFQDGSGAASQMSGAAGGSLFSQVVAAASLFRRAGNSSNRDMRGASISSSTGLHQGTQDGGFVAPYDSHPSRPESSASVFGGGGLHLNGAGGSALLSQTSDMSAAGMIQQYRARSGSNAGSVRGGRTSAASTHSRPSVLGGSMFTPPPQSFAGGGGSEAHSMLGGAGSSQRSALAGPGVGGGGGAGARDLRGGSFGTGSLSGSLTGERKKQRKGSAASSNELEHRFRAARAAAAGVSLPAPERSPSMQSRQGSVRGFGGALGGSGASVISGGTFSGLPGLDAAGMGRAGGGADAASVTSGNLFSESRSMISRVSTAASATASGLYGADYAQKAPAEIQAEMKVVEEEGDRMLDNFVALEQAIWAKTAVSPELLARIRDARRYRAAMAQGGKDGSGAGSGNKASNTATLRRSASLNSSDGWINTIRAAARDRRRSVTDTSGSIFSAFSFGRSKKDKEKDKAAAAAAGGQSLSTATSATSLAHAYAGEEGNDTQDTVMPSDAHSTIRGPSAAAAAAAAAASGLGPGGAYGSRRSRTGSLSGRSGYPPPSASALQARGLARPPPSAYRLSMSTGPEGGGGGGGGGSGRSYSRAGLPNGFSRSDMGHAGEDAGGMGAGGYSSDAELEESIANHGYGHGHASHPSGGSSRLNPLQSLLGAQAVEELELDPVTASEAASLVAELDDVDARKATVLKRYHERKAYLHSQLQSAKIRERLMAR